MPQGRASVGGASVELLRAAVMVAAVPLLLLAVEFTTCTASCPGPVDDEAPAAVKQEAGPPLVGYVAPCRVRMRCLYIPFAETALVEMN